MQPLRHLILHSSNQLSLPDLSELFLAVAHAFKPEGRPTTRQLLRSEKHSTSLWLISVMKDMAEQATELIDSDTALPVLSNLAYACVLVLPRQIRVSTLYASFRRLLLALLKHMLAEHVVPSTSQDLRKIFLAFTDINLLNPTYSKKMKRTLVRLAEELRDHQLVQEFTA
jgi:hypothetical protein